MTTFSERLKVLRITNGMTQKEVAGYLGIAERNYRRYEAGDVDPVGSKLIKLANCFDVSVDYLLCASNNPERR